MRKATNKPDFMTAKPDVPLGPVPSRDVYEWREYQVPIAMLQAQERCRRERD